MTATVKVEMDFPETLFKVEERLRIITANIMNNQDITEDDYGVLESVHRLWHEGHLTFYKHQFEGEGSSVVQGGLF